MESNEVQEAMRVLMLRIKGTSFIDGYNATKEEVMGMVLSKYFEWDGLAILKAAMYATEDANFHTESAKISEMVSALESWGEEKELLEECDGEHDSVEELIKCKSCEIIFKTI